MSARRRPVSEGWWVNESVPDIADLIPQGIDGAAFVAWLGPKLGEHRDAVHIRDNALMTPAERVDELKRTRDALKGAWDALHPQGLHQQVDVWVSDAWLRHRRPDETEIWHDVRERLRQDLLRAHMHFQVAINQLRSVKSKPGRKLEVSRDKLLSVVADKLTDALGIEAARARAADILLRCGVPTPANMRTRRRNDQRGRKLTTARVK
jgi:hypothetical protein